MARFFREICRIVGTRKVYTTKYNPKCNGQVGRFNRTIIAALQQYFRDHTRQWDLSTRALAHACNTQVHSSTRLAPFEMVLSRSPPHLGLESTPHIESGTTSNEFYLTWIYQLRSLMDTVRTQMGRSKERYRKNLKARVRRVNFPVTAGKTGFVRKDHAAAEEPRRKLAPLNSGPFKVSEVDEKTCLILRGNNIAQRVPLDRVVVAPTQICTGLASLGV